MTLPQKGFRMINGLDRFPWLLAIFCSLLPVDRANGLQDQPRQDQWPQFRGLAANLTGDGLQLPISWNVADHLKWAAEIPGRGWSSPIITNEKVFITSVISDREMKPAQTGTQYSNEYVAELAAQGLSAEEINRKVQERDFESPGGLNASYVLFCLDLTSGRELWRREYFLGEPPGGCHRKNSFASETPVTDGRRIYVYAANLGLFAYDLEGELVWKQPLSNQPIYLDFGTGSSPVLVEDRLIIQHDNEAQSTITAYDSATGKLIWESARGQFEEGERPAQASAWTTPLVWKHESRCEIVTIGPGRLVSYDLEGNELWRMKGMRPGPAASPVAEGERLIINAGAPFPVYAIQPGGTGDISLDRGESSNQFVQWSRPRSSTYIPTPLIYQNGIYLLGDNGILTRLDLQTGEETFKKRVRGSGADFTSSPWAYDNHIYLASEQGEIFVITSGPEYQLVQTIPIGEMMMASPAMVPGTLILRTEKRILAIGN
jgi:outer membrane protein assembly factor BamB